MAKERLSKLQKWILIDCYQDSHKAIGRKHIIYEFYKKPGDNFYLSEKRRNTIEAVLSRSVWSLVDKGFIKGLSPMKLSNVALIYGMQGKSVEDFNKDFGDMKLSEKIATLSIRKFNKIKVITITDKGKTKAKELLKVK